MASEAVRSPLVRALAALGLALLAAVPAARAATDKPAPTIFSCIGADGKKITSDRPIPECTGRDLRKLNADGSLNSIVPPPMTIEERERKEAQEREAEAKDMLAKQWVRADRNLMQLYPTEASHRKARNKALEDFNKSVGALQARIALLQKERKPLVDEAEFYPNGKLPSKLKNALDANDASLNAQRALVEKQQDEVARINATYDIELARLKKLWTGTQPGSLGPLPGPGPQMAAQPAVAVKAPDAVKTSVTK